MATARATELVKTPRRIRERTPTRVGETQGREKAAVRNDPRREAEFSNAQTQ
jgi:hypothetical protein